MQNQISDFFPFDFEVECNSNMFFVREKKKKILFSNSIYHSTFCENKMQRRIISTSKKSICMCLIVLMSLRLPAVRVDRTLSTIVCEVFLITRDNGTVFSLTISSFQQSKDFILGNKYMHSLEGKEHLLFQMNTDMFRGACIVHLNDPEINFFSSRSVNLCVLTAEGLLRCRLTGPD